MKSKNLSINKMSKSAAEELEFLEMKCPISVRYSIIAKIKSLS
jgi:hypothetical protein